MADDSERKISRASGETAKLLILEVFRTLRTAIRWGAIGYCIYSSKDLLLAIAGKETILALRFAFLADFKFAASVTLAGCATLWAIIERWLRLRKTESLAGRNAELEKSHDPNRSSSGLTPAGRTHPRDKLP